MELVMLRSMTFFLLFHIQKSIAIERIGKTNDHVHKNKTEKNENTELKQFPSIKVDFDSPLFIHDKLELECDIYLRSEQVLYSVKWYKDDKEFFVYFPLENRATRLYPMRGIHFDTPTYSHINNSLFVWLKNINLDSQGIYQCEVSTDAPEFAIYKNQKRFEVLVVPSRGPRITGSRSNFSLKNRVDLNCTAPRSRPLPVLQWLINDQPAPDEYLIPYSRTNYSDGLSSKTLRIRFTVTEQHYRNGNMQLKCVASYKKLQLHGGVTRRHSKMNKKKSTDLPLVIDEKMNEFNKKINGNHASSSSSIYSLLWCSKLCSRNRNTYECLTIIIYATLVYMTTTYLSTD